jgi:hypothetical protein
MAYPTGIIAKVLDDIDRRIIEIKQDAQQKVTEYSAGNAQASSIIGLYIKLRLQRTKLLEASNIPGLVDYAKQQKNDTNLNVVTEFNTIIGLINTITTWITDNFPKNAAGYLLKEQFSLTGTIERSFTPIETEQLRTHLSNLIAAIN